MRAPMARKGRAEVEGGLYHVITRGNNRRQIFHSLAAKEMLILIGLQMGASMKALSEAIGVSPSTLNPHYFFLDSTDLILQLQLNAAITNSMLRSVIFKFVLLVFHQVRIADENIPAFF